MLSKAEVETFLIQEARLMDEHRYIEWLSLWTDDAIYWVPCRHETSDPDCEVSIIYDNRRKLNDRVSRLQSGSVLVQDPLPRMRRLIANVEIESEADSRITVASNFMLIQARGAEQIMWAGRSIHHLRRDGVSIRMSCKKILLVNSEQEMPLLQFLL